MTATIKEPQVAEAAPEAVLEHEGIAAEGPTASDADTTTLVTETLADDGAPDEVDGATAGLTASDASITPPIIDAEAADVTPDEQNSAAVVPTVADLGVTAAVATKAAERVPARQSIASASPMAPESLQRKSRWKKRGGTVWRERLSVIGGLLLVVGIALTATILLRSGADATHAGPDTPFAKAVFEAFPEADPARIDSAYQDDLPLAATLHLPAHLIEPGQGRSNPFAQLGAQFGGTERTLSGVEMASRLEKIGNTVLPADMVRCHTYEIGEVSSAPESPRRTRILRLRLNPGC